MRGVRLDMRSGSSCMQHLRGVRYAIWNHHHHHHHQKVFRNKSHTSHGHRPGLKRNKIWKVCHLEYTSTIVSDAHA